MTVKINDIFKAYDVRGKVGTELTAKSAHEIGQAFADYLPQNGPVAVGRDMRPDSAELATALMKGLTAQGRDVLDLGEITSDMSYFAVGKYNLAGAAMVTASHNPGEYNGIKLYRDNVIPVGLDSGLDIIRDAVLSSSFEQSPDKPGSITQKDIIADWVGHCMNFVTVELQPYSIAVDAGNGMAGKIFPHIQEHLPFSVRQMYFDLDGTFPNHEANPQKPENLKDLAKAVKEGGLDFGIAFDGDGDRAGFVDDLGRPVNGTDLISIVAHDYLQKYPGAEIIHEVRTSKATQELVSEWGGVPFRTKAGRVSIGKVMRDRGAPFGGETTGHLFFRENYFADSGMIAALMVIVALQKSGKKLSELVDEYHQYPTITETNFEVNNPSQVLQKLSNAFETEPQDTLDGLTVNFADNSWFNIRASNTEPLVRLNAEAPSKERLDELVAKVTSIVAS